MIKEKWIIAAGAATVAIMAVGVPIASSWASGLPPGATEVYCYKHGSEEENPERVHLTGVDNLSQDSTMTVTKTQETWDTKDKIYTPGTPEEKQAKIDPLWATEMTYLCRIFAGEDYKYATGG
jgi:hypothetical protein